MPIGPVELIIVLVIALIVLGPGKLPDVGAALGKGIREFRRASSDLQDAARIDPAPAAPATTPSPAAQPAAAPVPPPTAAGEATTQPKP